MVARLSAFVIWALVAATAVFWGLRLFVRAPAAPSYTVAVGDSSAVRGDLTRLLGAAPVNAPTQAVAPEAASRFRLLGIVAPKYAEAATREAPGVALIAVDGKMPKAYRVGARLDGDLVLQSVSLRTVSISAAQGAPAITLELPLPAMAATGTLPAAAVEAPMTPPRPTPSFVPQPMMPQSMQPPMPQPVPPPPGQQRPDSTAPTE
jgi:general secretion pathway protein C